MLPHYPELISVVLVRVNIGSTQFKCLSKYGCTILHLFYKLVKDYMNLPVCACMKKGQRGCLWLCIEVIKTITRVISFDNSFVVSVGYAWHTFWGPRSLG